MIDPDTWQDYSTRYFAVQIAEKWYRFYILKETLTPEKINKKI